MGAFSTLCALDVEGLRGVVAPAVRVLLATGERGGPLARLWQDDLDELRASEARWAAHYDSHPKLSRQLEALGAGLGIRLDEHCELLDDTLAVTAPTVAEMAAIVPSIKGACLSTTCVVLARCPMHTSQLGPTGAETLGRLIKQAVFGCCVADPPDVQLGRRGTASGLRWWYLHERGYGDDYPVVDVPVFLAQDDPLVGLLVALTQRGAAWGWGDGGFGEGLLGWLDATEAGALADALAAYDLSPNAPSPERYDEYTRQHELPPARALVGKLRDQARRCGERGLGVLLRRD